MTTIQVADIMRADLEAAGYHRSTARIVVDIYFGWDRDPMAPDYPALGRERTVTLMADSRDAAEGEAVQ